METLFHIVLAIAALGVPLACAYVIVRRLGRRNARQHLYDREKNGSQNLSQ